MNSSQAHELEARIPEAVDEVLDDGLHKAVEAERYTLIDHLSHFSGLAVAQFYILCAGITLYEVIARYA